MPGKSGDVAGFNIMTYKSPRHLPGYREVGSVRKKQPVVDLAFTDITIFSVSEYMHDNETHKCP